MRGVIQDIRSLGAELVVVGSGKPFHAAAFRDDQEIDFPLLVDPDLVAYEAAGLRRGVAATLNWKMARNAFRAFRSGFRQTSVQGDPWQLGGTFVLLPGGDCAFAHVSSEAGDHPEVNAVLSALRGAVLRR